MRVGVARTERGREEAGLEKFKKTRGKVLTLVKRSGEERTNILPSGKLSLTSIRRIYEHVCITHTDYTVCVCLHVSGSKCIPPRAAIYHLSAVLI